MKYLLSLLLLPLLCSCADVQHTETERKLSTELHICLEKSTQQRMEIFEEKLQSAILSEMAEQCMEGGQELAARLNSCVDILLSEDCNIRAFENVSADEMR